MGPVGSLPGHGGEGGPDTNGARFCATVYWNAIEVHEAFSVRVAYCMLPICAVSSCLNPPLVSTGASFNKR